jgi:hypothetical protein
LDVEQVNVGVSSGNDDMVCDGEHPSAALLQRKATQHEHDGAPVAEDKAPQAMKKTKSQGKSVLQKSASGAAAPLTEAGYQGVAVHRSSNEMAKFVRRVVTELGLCIEDEGGLFGLSHWYSGVKDVQNFLRLRTEILNVSKHEGSWISDCEPKRKKTMIKSSYIPTSIVLTSKAEDKEDVQADAKPHKQEREHESMSRKSVLVEHSQEQIAKSDAKSAGAKKVKRMDRKDTEASQIDAAHEGKIQKPKQGKKLDLAEDAKEKVKSSEKELAERKSGDDVSVKHRSTVASKKKPSKITK